MNRILTATAAAFLVAGSSLALAQTQPLTEPPAGGQATPQTAPGEKNETGIVEANQMQNDSTNRRVQPEVGADQAAAAMTEQTGVPMEAQPGAIVTPAN